MKISITENKDLRQFAGIALFNLGFRPFFLGAGIYAVVVMLIWWLQYSGISGAKHLTAAWHAHEMIFGYTFAVIAGFLLTSVRNWTGIDTVSGGKLFALFSLWVLARLGNSLGSDGYSALLDLVFMLLVAWYVVTPIIRVKQWRQTSVVGILCVLWLANGLYYAGLLGMVNNGVNVGIYLGFYLIVGLVLVMTGRVIPFFTERGVAETISLRSYPWLEVLLFVVYAGFVLVHLFPPEFHLADEFQTGLAAALFVLNILRLGSWYTRGIWQRPLLWSLFLAYGFITLGFGLYALLYFGWFSIFIPIHALAVGGVGLVTLGMMARVSLGHSGRSIDDPSRWVVLAFVVLFLGAITRVILPVIFPAYYLWLIQASQLLWIVSFSLFLVVYAPILVAPRVDKQPG